MRGLLLLLLLLVEADPGGRGRGEPPWQISGAAAARQVLRATQAPLRSGLLGAGGSPGAGGRGVLLVEYRSAAKLLIANRNRSNRKPKTEIGHVIG